MHRNLLSQYIQSDARQVSQGLLASLESIEAINQRDESRNEALHKARSLAIQISRDLPDNVAAHEGMVQLVNGLLPEGDRPAMESLGSIIAGIFGKKGKPKSIPEEEKWNQEHRNEIARFLKELDKTYLNAGWLAKQKFVEGEIPSTDISPYFTVNNHIGKDPLRNVTVARDSVEKFCRAWGQVLKSIDNQVQAIEKRCHAACKGKDEGDEEALAVVRKAVEELNKIPDPIPKLPKMGTTAIKNLNIFVDDNGFVDTKSIPDVKPQATMPALNKEEILYGAKMVKEMLSDREWDPSVKLLRSLSWLDFEDGSDFSAWIYESDYSLYEDFYDRFYFQGDPERWTWGIIDMLERYKTAVAIIKYIDRSIK